MTVSEKKPGAVRLLFVLQAFLGLGAVAGGLVLLADPSGEMIGMPASLLERSPFDSYAIPGILLLVIFGLLPLMVLYGLFKQPEWSWGYALTPFKALHAAWSFSLYIGFGQIIWIMVQTYMMDTVSIVHVFYMSLGMLVQIVTLLPAVQRYFMLDGRSERS
ncbi:hypothetical protein QW71_35575 [Paenibacillus sp. IHB B 3415]|uniref:hypothetical protein n=1 Tax=Paenibacillus sp. IHB B 3415 TaxID=867080 RepID=UPI000574C408|nr:hypothetical protein [Paenibacillus sp. IHB B 3415]KHL91278.1 hypothetical protein QW71_35575 [Paenibacillus sp. IHB B 3415]